MANEEYNRSDFIKALMNQQKGTTSQGGSLLNPSVAQSDNVQDLAYLNTDIPKQSNIVSADLETARKASDDNVISKIFGFVDEIAAKFGAGFVSAWEGGLDFFANAIGALGDSTGWYSGDPFTNWAKQDIGTAASEWIKTYANFTPWGIVSNIANGNYGNSEYWQSMGESAVDIGNSALFMNNELQDMRKHSDQYYGLNDEIETEAGNFVGGVANAIGFMLPSIMTGNSFGLGQKATQAITLASMGLSASGKGAEEALNEGATSTQALGTGLAKGLTEVASEIVVGKTLKLAGLGTGKVFGLIGGKAVEVGTNSFKKELAKTMFEEGLEEVFSGLLEPLTDSIYKGTEELEKYKNTSFWFGADGHFNESILGQFVSGAVTSGIMGGASRVAINKKVSKEGANVIGIVGNLAEVDNKMKKLETKDNYLSSAEYQELSQTRTNLMSDFAKSLNNVSEHATDSQKATLISYLTTENGISKLFNENMSFNDKIKTTINEYSHDKLTARNFLKDMQTQYGTDVKLEFNDSMKENGSWNEKTNTITINSNILDSKGGSTLVHEYMGHVLSSKLSKANIRTMYNEVLSDTTTKEIIDTIKTTYPELKPSSIEFQEEVVSKYLETIFEDGNLAKQIKTAKKSFKPSLVEKVLETWNKSDITKSKTIAREYAKQINTLLKQAGNKTISNVAYKLASKQTLSDKEKVIYNRYTNVINMLKSYLAPKETNTRVAYSKANLTYKSMDTVKDILTNVKSQIESSLDNKYKLTFARDSYKTTDIAFSEINNVKTTKTQAKHLLELLLNSDMSELDTETSKYKRVGKLEDFLNVDDMTKEEILQIIESIIESEEIIEAKNKTTYPLEKTINKLLSKKERTQDSADRMAVLMHKRDKIRKNVDNLLDLTEDNVARNGLKVLYEPFKQLHRNKGTFSAKGFKNALNEVLGFYTEEHITEKFPTLIFEPALRDKIESLYTELQEPQFNGERVSYGNLSANQMNQAIDILEMLDNTIKKSNEDYMTKIKPISDISYSEIANMKYGSKDNIAAKLFRAYKRGFEPSYMTIQEILGGNSSLARMATGDLLTAMSNAKLKNGNYNSLIEGKIKELKISKHFKGKSFELNGLTLTNDQALNLYVSLNVEANYNAINEEGIQFYKKGSDKISKVLYKGRAEELKVLINEKLSPNMKQLGDFLLDMMNNELKQDYIDMFEKRFGEFNGRNEIGKVGENKYWTINRSYQKFSSVEKAISNPLGTFAQAKKRTGSSNAVLVRGALDNVQSYINGITQEIYIKPVYRDIVRILNVKNSEDSSIIKLLTEKVGNKGIDFLKITLDDAVGAYKPNTNDLLQSLVGIFSVHKLGFNPSSFLKNFASLLTSNIPLTTQLRSATTRLFSNNKVKAEYQELRERIGSLKYRSGAVLQANADSIKGKVGKIAEFGMKGIEFVDNFTFSTGAYSLMTIAEKDFGHKIGTKENIDWVVDHWHEFEVTQQGNTALSRGGVSRGQYGNLSKMLFGFLQGDNRALLGSQIHKWNLWARNKKISNETYKTWLEEYKQAKKNVDSLYETYRNNQTKENKESYISAKTKALDLENKIKDFESYKIAGGKNIPLLNASSLVLQGTFIALVAELIKHLKGKEEWDEWNAQNILVDILTNSTIEWLPFFNSMYNSFGEGFELNIPPVEIINDLINVFDYAKNGNWRIFGLNLAKFGAEMLGVNFDTFYDYTYGMIKAFNPATALEMRNVFYGLTDRIILDSIKTYSDKGNYNKTYSLVEQMFKGFKTGNTNSVVIGRITKLYMAGYTDVLPKSVMTSYTNSNGETIELTKTQQDRFKQYYSLADKEVLKASSSSWYGSLTQAEKAKMVRKIYDYYYNYAKCKVLNTEPDNKMVKLLVLSNGGLNCVSFEPILTKIKTIVATDSKTRKELVIDYINSLTNISKQDKILIMYLAGYGLNDSNKKILSSYLSSKGISASSVKEILE